MSDPSSAIGFSNRRARSFARLTAYALLSLFLISAVAAFLPPPFRQPERLFPVLGELLAERSTLPLLALILLFLGFGGRAAPAVWEARLAALLRPLLRLAALLYLITGLALFAVVGQIRSLSGAQISAPFDANLRAIAALRSQVRAAADGGSLRRLLEAQPPFRPLLSDPTSPLAAADAPVDRQRRAALQLLERAEANLRSDDLRRRADADGILLKENLRLSLTALVYAVFYLLASALWPRQLASLLQRARSARAAQAQDDDEAGPEAADAGGDWSG